MSTRNLIARTFRAAVLLLLIVGCATTARWKETTTANTIAAYEDFVQRHPRSEHVAEARQRLEVLYAQREWAAARQTDDTKAYEDFVQRRPRSDHIGEAESRLLLLEQYRDGWEKLQQTPTVQTFTDYCAQNPKSPYLSRARAALADMEGRDIVDLIAEKKIEIQAQGSGIARVSVRIRRLAPYPLTVRIPVGSFFVSSNASAQNMVTTAESKVLLTSQDWLSVSPDAACANRPRDIPGSSDAFTVQRSPHQAELAKLMPVLEKARVDTETRQAAVWIITDNADYSDLGILVASRFGFGGSRVINEQETARAMKICDEAGIDITKKAIWNDRQRVMSGLKDGDLKVWLEQKQ